MSTTKSVVRVLGILSRRYRRAATASDRRTPFAVLITTILSARTKDETTAEAANRLFQRYRTVLVLAQAAVHEVRRLIRPVGFFRTKARHIIAASGRVVEAFHGRVPTAMEDLLSLPGVGRKTANVVRNYAFRRAAIAVDTHVHRVSNRLGWVRTEKPEDTERALEIVVPRRLWVQVNDRFVKFGKDICRPITPQCWRCPVVRWCRYPKKVFTPPGGIR